MNQIIRFLDDRECEVEVGFIDKETVGIMDFNTNTITLNIAVMIVNTLIHEYYHYLYPHFSKAKVIKKTDKKMGRLSRKQIERIAQRIMEVANE